MLVLACPPAGLVLLRRDSAVSGFLLVCPELKFPLRLRWRRRPSLASDPSPPWATPHRARHVSGGRALAVPKVLCAASGNLWCEDLQAA